MPCRAGNIPFGRLAEGRGCIGRTGFAEIANGGLEPRLPLGQRLVQRPFRRAAGFGDAVGSLYNLCASHSIIRSEYNQVFANQASSELNSHAQSYKIKTQPMLLAGTGGTYDRAN